MKNLKPIIFVAILAAICWAGTHNDKTAASATIAAPAAETGDYLRNECKSGTFDMRGELGRFKARFCRSVPPGVDPWDMLMNQIVDYGDGDESVSELAKWLYGRTTR